MSACETRETVRQALFAIAERTSDLDDLVLKLEDDPAAGGWLPCWGATW
jgi:hypothetical protein